MWGPKPCLIQSYRKLGVRHTDPAGAQRRREEGNLAAEGTQAEGDIAWSLRRDGGSGDAEARVLFMKQFSTRIAVKSAQSRSGLVGIEVTSLAYLGNNRYTHLIIM